VVSQIRTAKMPAVPVGRNAVETVAVARTDVVLALGVTVPTTVGDPLPVRRIKSQFTVLPAELVEMVTSSVAVLVPEVPSAVSVGSK